MAATKRKWLSGFAWTSTKTKHTHTQKKKKNPIKEGGGAKMAEEQDGETTFSPANSSEEQLNAEQSSQNTFWSLAADIRRPERQPTVFEGRQDKI